MMLYKEYDEETLKKLHEVHLEILDVFTKICDKYHLEYFLTGGTLLGAVRHAGFIPWDDDVDIGMPRSDYDKFIKIAQEELKDKYYLDCFETNKDFYLPFAKIKKNGTVFDEGFSEKVKCHKGIFIDIFPFENVKKNNLAYKLRYIFSLIVIDAVFTKKRMRKLKNMTCAILSIILSILPKKWLVKLFHFIVTMNHNDNSDYISVIGTGYGYSHEIMKRDKILPVKKVLFEEKKYNGMADNDYYLTRIFGNYMELPPKEKRCNHMPRKIDFGK